MNEIIKNILLEAKWNNCSKCNENSIIKIMDYKLEIKGNNNHYILIKYFNNKIYLSKIICYNWDKNRNNIYKYIFSLDLKYNIICALFIN